MTDDARQSGSPYKLYWVSWALLLVITVAMLGAEAVHMPRWVLVPFLVSFMMVKAVMIGGNFMHLRFENRRLWLMVGVSLLLTSIILFTFIVPETWNIAARSVTR